MRTASLGPMAFQGSRWLLHAHADRHREHGSKTRTRSICFATAGGQPHLQAYLHQVGDIALLVTNDQLLLI